jgi:hypothetical protein
LPIANRTQFNLIWAPHGFPLTLQTNYIQCFDKITVIPFQIILNSSFINHSILPDRKVSLINSPTGIVRNDSNSKSIINKVKPSWCIRTVQNCILEHKSDLHERKLKLRKCSTRSENYYVANKLVHDSRRSQFRHFRSGLHSAI